MTRTDHKYVVRIPGVRGGSPVIEGTRIGVNDLAEYHNMGFSPEKIQEIYPHLSLGQVYDGLSYYFDHRGEIDEIISANEVPEYMVGLSWPQDAQPGEGIGEFMDRKRRECES